LSLKIFKTLPSPGFSMASPVNLPAQGLDHDPGFLDALGILPHGWNHGLRFTSGADWSAGNRD